MPTLLRIFYTLSLLALSYGESSSASSNDIAQQTSSIQSKSLSTLPSTEAAVDSESLQSVSSHATSNNAQQCPKVPSLLSHPDLEMVAGVWYKMASTPSPNNDFYECNVAYNEWLSKNKTIQVKAFNYKKIGDQLLENWSGNIYLDSSGNIANSIVSPENETMAYWTFFADNYATYQISYGCPVVNGQEIGRLIWIQSRFCHFNENIFNKSVALLAKAGVTNVPWVKFANKKCCPYGSQSSVDPRQSN